MFDRYVVQLCRIGHIGIHGAAAGIFAQAFIMGGVTASGTGDHREGFVTLGVFHHFCRVIAESCSCSLCMRPECSDAATQRTITPDELARALGQGPADSPAMA